MIKVQIVIKARNQIQLYLIIYAILMIQIIIWILIAKKKFQLILIFLKIKIPEKVISLKILNYLDISKYLEEIIC